MPSRRFPLKNQIKPEVDEIFLKYLVSKRKEFGPKDYKFSWLDITAAERKRLYEIADQAGLLTHYEFSGVKSAGTSRNDAARRMLDQTHERAFAKLKAEFGAKAHFWVKPVQLCFLCIDFYWRQAKLGVVITGPLMDDLAKVGPERRRDNQRDLTPFESNESSDITILRFPYYVVWHHPAEFLNTIRQKLIASGRYPKLAGQSDS